MVEVVVVGMFTGEAADAIEDFLVFGRHGDGGGRSESQRAEGGGRMAEGGRNAVCFVRLLVFVCGRKFYGSGGGSERDMLPGTTLSTKVL